MPNTMPSNRNISDEDAWKYTMQVEKWIWKYIKNRNIKHEDQEDVFSICRIEVFELMKRYRPEYSITTWANFGILKGLNTYDANRGAFRVPFYVVEKIKRLMKEMEKQDQIGNPMTNEDIEIFTGMPIELVQISMKKISTQESPEDDPTYFLDSKASQHTPHLDIIHHNADSRPEDSVFQNQLMESIYTVMDNLTTMEIYIIVLRFGLDLEKSPSRKEFRTRGHRLNMRGYKKGETFSLKQIGERLGFTKERVRQIEYRALEKLKKNPNLRNKLRF